MCGIADSRTSLGSVLKGRSASRAIQLALQLTNPLLLAGGIQITMLFGPTRLKVADDPTWDSPVRLPLLPLPPWVAHPEAFREISALPPLPRVLAAWARLVVNELVRLLRLRRDPFARRGRHELLVMPRAWRSCALWSPGPSQAGPSAAQWNRSSEGGTSAVLGFDQALGYPGEGPRAPAGKNLARELPLEDLGRPRNAATDATLERRRAVPLQAGRPVKQQTRTARARELRRLEVFLQTEGYAEFWEWAKAADPPADEALSAYGQCLWAGGAPYGRFAETVNAVASAAPALRGHTPSAWELAFQWLD